jgi:hypothetical protein
MVNRSVRPEFVEGFLSFLADIRALRQIQGERKRLGIKGVSCGHS